MIATFRKRPRNFLEQIFKQVACSERCSNYQGGPFGRPSSGRWDGHRYAGRRLYGAPTSLRQPVTRGPPTGPSLASKAGSNLVYLSIPPPTTSSGTRLGLRSHASINVNSTGP